MIVAAYFERQARAARAELRDVRAAYESMRDNYRRVLLCLDAANDREDVLGRRVAELEGQCDVLACDLADEQRLNAAYRNGLSFFDPSQGGGR